VEWREAGLDVQLTRDGVEYEFGAICAGAWWRAGCSLRDADLLTSQESDLAEAQRRMERCGSAARIVTLVRRSA